MRSDERTVHLSNTEWWVLRIAVVSCTAAIAMFTSTKWEVERRLAELPEDDREAWMAGNYQEHKEKKLKLASVAVADDNTEGFIASDSFEGYRPGMVFKKGKDGVGYYLDEVGSGAAAAVDAGGD